MSIGNLKVSELKQALDDIDVHYSPKSTKKELVAILDSALRSPGRKPKSLKRKSPKRKSPRRRRSPIRYSPPRRRSPMRRRYSPYRRAPYDAYEPVVPLAIDPLAFKPPKTPKSPWERKAEHIGIINKVARAINDLHNVVTNGKGAPGTKAAFQHYKAEAENALYEARQYHNMPLNYYNRLLKAINAYETKYGYNIAETAVRLYPFLFFPD